MSELLPQEDWTAGVSAAMGRLYSRFSLARDVDPPTDQDYLALGEIEPATAAALIIMSRNMTYNAKRAEDLAITAFNAGARQ